MRRRTIDRLTDCTKEQFQHYFNNQKPCLIANQSKYFESRWSLYKPFIKQHHFSGTTIEELHRRFQQSSLYNQYGERMVPVEQGNHFLTPNSTTFHVPLRLYIDAMINYEIEKLQNHVIPDSNVLYLTQYEIFDQIPELKQEIETLEYCHAGKGDLYLTSISLVPSDTVTPFHYELQHSIYCQLVGDRKFYLIDPNEVTDASMKPYEKFPFNRTSTLSTDSILVDNRQQFPLYEVDIQETDLLFIPKRYWFADKSQSLNFSVNFSFL
jgi:hypothetical protein